MATGGLTYLRGNNAAIGWAKEAAWGTGLVPTSWWRWRQGTAHKMNPSDQAGKEGDAGPFENLAWRTDNYGDVTVAEAVRPITIGCALQALLGTGSDTYTAPTVNTTVGTGGGTAGGTTIVLSTDLGSVGTQALNLNPGVASATYEVVTIDKTTKSGVAPTVTYSLAAGAKLKFNHLAAETVTSASTHVFKRQRRSYDPYAITVYRGDGTNAPFQAHQYLDSVCHDLTLDSGPGGSPLMARHMWYATQQQLIAWGTPSPVLEGNGQVGTTGAPFTHAMANATWNVSGVTTGNALTIEKMALALKNSTNAKEFVSEGIHPAYFVPDDMALDLTLTVQFQTYADFYATYFGGVSTAGTVDSPLIGYGSFLVTYQMDAINALTISLPYTRYAAAPVPEPAEKSSPVKQQIAMRAMISNANPDALILTLANSQASVY